MAGAYRPDVTAIPLGRPSPGASSNQPERQANGRPCGARRRRASLLFGFAPGGACRAADVAARAVRSYRTLSPLPGRFLGLAARAPAVCFLWRFPWGFPRRTLSGAASAWSPDFPPLRSGGRPADWLVTAYVSDDGAVKHNRAPAPRRGTNDRARSLKLHANYGRVAPGGAWPASAASVRTGDIEAR